MVASMHEHVDRAGNARRSPELPDRTVSAAALLGLLLLAPITIAAQDIPASSADAARLLEEARDRQEEFERFRASRIPVSRQRSQPTCDERIGRICIWFGGEGETGFPREAPEVGEARVELISFLSGLAELAPDRWVIGQLVYYLIENRDVDGATRMATECGIPEVWWCAALRGYILHLTADDIASEAAFREALASMPPDERESWMSPRFVLTGDGQKLFEQMAPAERDRLWELFWRLSDPLFLVGGNDRLTDHFARIVEAVNWRDAANPMGMSWAEDMEATLIRYGRNIGYSRTFDPAATMNGAGDTRRVQGHHHPKSRGYLFPEVFLESPSDVPPESWITAPREARTWYAPRYAPEMRALETQVGRFRRGADMLVVAAYRPVPPEADSAETRAPKADAQRPAGFGIRKGERFPVVWEAYGLSVDEPVRITLGFTRGRPGFLTRVGEFLGVLEPDQPVVVVFEDPGPDSVQTAFRSIELQLPDLDPGEYTIHLRLELEGREPVVTSRPIIVE
jgi:hypothetical protein